MASSEHVLLSADKYARLLQRVKDCESRDTEGEKLQGISGNETADSVEDSSKKSSPPETQTKDSTLFEQLPSAEKQTDGGKSSATKRGGKVTSTPSVRSKEGEGQVKSDSESVVNKRGVTQSNKISKKDLLVKLRPPGRVERNKGNKKPRWETLS